MFRFDQLIHSRMIVRDIKREWPATIELFDRYGFRPSCDDCDLQSLARKHGLNVADVVTALNLAIAAPAVRVG
jgi:hypothetical protein